MANIRGTNSDDILNSGNENDILTGGSGKDKFVYELGDGSDYYNQFSWRR